MPACDYLSAPQCWPVAADMLVGSPPIRSFRPRADHYDSPPPPARQPRLLITAIRRTTPPFPDFTPFLTWSGFVAFVVGYRRTRASPDSDWRLHSTRRRLCLRDASLIILRRESVGMMPPGFGGYSRLLATVSLARSHRLRRRHGGSHRFTSPKLACRRRSRGSPVIDNATKAFSR